MRVLMSIKPKYVKSILNGTKKFEFRKKIFKRTDIDEIIIYSSSPEKKIVGSFEIDKVLKDSPEELWAYCWNSAGISKENFFKYFKGKDHGFAIKIKNLKIFSIKIDPYKLILGFRPPQSFLYISNSQLRKILKAEKEKTKPRCKKCGGELSLWKVGEPIEYFELFCYNCKENQFKISYNDIVQLIYKKYEEAN